jgi:L-lactate dehydrogenase complex protein LldE
VGLFVTCLVDLFRPSVGFAAVKLLEESGCDVEVPAAQTCCAQPAWNSGDRADARAVAETVLKAFAGLDYVVAPSGSCAGMIRLHYPELFAGTPFETQARDVAARTWELTSFLVDVMKLERVQPRAGAVRHDATITYHDSCSGLRELGVKAQPRKLLGSIEGLKLKELPGAEVCCGFGGTFCVKYPEISGKIVAEKTADIAATGAELLLAGDMGCLLNMAGRLSREGRPVAVRHVAEVLAGMTTEPPIGAAAKG